MRAPLVAAVALTAVAAAAEEAKWVTVASGAITVKTRALPGSPVQEVLAERDVAAPAGAVGQVIFDVERFPKFMPYVKETKLVGAPADDGSRVVYTSLGLPFVAARDFVIRDRVVQPLDSGELVTEWHVIDSEVARRDGYVRLAHNTGSWRVKPTGAATCHVVYQFAVDPGGKIPGWIADIGNRSGVPDVFRAVENEAQRVAKAR